MGMLSVYLIRQPADDWVEKKIKLGEQKASKAIRMTATTTAATTTTTAATTTTTAATTTTTAALVNQPSSNGLPCSEEPTPESSPTKQVRIFLDETILFEMKSNSQ